MDSEATSPPSSTVRLLCVLALIAIPVAILYTAKRPAPTPPRPPALVVPLGTNNVVIGAAFYDPASRDFGGTVLAVDNAYKFDHGTIRPGVLVKARNSLGAAGEHAPGACGSPVNEATRGVAQMEVGFGPIVVGPSYWQPAGRIETYETGALAYAAVSCGLWDCCCIYPEHRSGHLCVGDVRSFRRRTSRRSRIRILQAAQCDCRRLRDGKSASSLRQSLGAT